MRAIVWNDAGTGICHCPFCQGDFDKDKCIQKQIKTGDKIRILSGLGGQKDEELEVALLTENGYPLVLNPSSPDLGLLEAQVFDLIV